jgi:uncharacterized protein YndB with AHSA1/START domain
MSDLPVYIYNRTFDAPVPTVWNAWTDPKLLAIWYGPGVETIIHEYDARPGGVWLNEMKWGDKSDLSRMDFVQVEPEAKLVWNHSSTDKDWKISPNQMMPNWPQTLLTTVTFTRDGAQTKVRLKQVPVKASEVEITCFAEMMGSMDGGWGKGFDLLEKVLSEHGASA